MEPTVNISNGNEGQEQQVLKPWPTSVSLYKPLIKEQIVLPDLGNCWSISTHLDMCKLPFAQFESVSCEFISSAANLCKFPFLRIEEKMLDSEYEYLVQELKVYEGADLNNWLTKEQADEVSANTTYMVTLLTLCETHSCYMDVANYREYTRPRNLEGNPWPLNLKEDLFKRRAAADLLDILDWKYMSEAQMLGQLQIVCQMLHNLLHKTGNEQSLYLYGTQPCSLDAAIYSHLLAIILTEMPNKCLYNTLLFFPSLVRYVLKIDVILYNGKHRQILENLIDSIGEQESHVQGGNADANVNVDE